ncbi:MAG: fluoride efflux transporter CrcB [Deltaproteobacteria bacterium]|nr:fluoride efflux transporter CrcB [Deltaproteobacteria bacterium]
MRYLAPYLWVGLGGFVGANVRYLVANLARRLLGVGFPYGTFFINVSGSFALGLVLAAVAERAFPHADELRLALAVGFLGAYTTFSTYEYECHALLKDGEWALALANMFGSLLLGLVAVRLGIALGRHWPW